MKNNNTQANKLDLDKITKEYRGKIWNWSCFGGHKVKSLHDVVLQDREEIVSDALTELIENIKSGKYRGLHGDDSLTSYAKTVYMGKRNDYFRIMHGEGGKEEFKDRTFIPKTNGYSTFSDEEGDTFKDGWLDNLKPAPSPFMSQREGEKFMRTLPGRDPMDVYSDKERKAIEAKIEEGSKHLDVLRYYKEEYSRKGIADKTGKTETQVKRIIEYEKQRRAKIGKSLGHQKVRRGSKYVDKSLKLMIDESFWKDNTKIVMHKGKIHNLEYVVPPRETRKYKGFYKGHMELINKMRKIQHKQVKEWGFCVQCGEYMRIKFIVEKNTLSYCLECAKNYERILVYEQLDVPVLQEMCQI